MIFVTGGTGLLGAYLLLELTQKDQEIRALKRSGSSIKIVENVFKTNHADPNRLLKKISWVDGDIMDIFSLENALTGIDYVYHCAALVSFDPKDIDRMMQINIEGTANVVNTCLQKGVKKLCHVSSIAALGRDELGGETTEKTNWKSSRQNSNYAISKYGGEREVWRGIEEGLKAVIVNPSIIIGMGDPEKGSSKLISTIDGFSKFYSNGINGFVDVRDVADSMITLMESDIENERFIVNGGNFSYRTLFELIALHLNKPKPLYAIPNIVLATWWRIEKLRSLISDSTPIITKETARTSKHQHYYSGKKLTEKTGFNYRSFEETISEACRIYTIWKTELRLKK
ncbi:MAG: NAD-dependent epimerase/dehydratase family protein [Bacteroidetes bacterium]|nr:NAD-dependent epimerase/dehydratase family protein [Bacteroidota bacterium]